MEPARGELSADVVVVGGGITGLTAAAHLHEAGRAVVLLEAERCGAGATGLSSGIVTPDSELELAELVRRFGPRDATTLWRAAEGACDEIRRVAAPGTTTDADVLYVASAPRDVGAIREEHETRERLGFPSRFYDRGALSAVLAGGGYHAGVRAGGTFGVDGRAWAAARAAQLAASGVRIHEGSRVVRVAPGAVHTLGAIVRAPAIVLCLDRYAAPLGIAARDVHRARASITRTEPLPEALQDALFPDGPLMVWDTKLVYSYYRLTGDGRLLVGGGLLGETYAAREPPTGRAFAALQREIVARFPPLAGVRFTDAWHGLIGMTRDLLPIAGRSATTPSHYYALCAAGLPWSVLAARTAAAAVLGRPGELDRFFAPDRRFTPFDGLAAVTGKGPAWALSYYYARHLQRSGSR